MMPSSSTQNDKGPVGLLGEFVWHVVSRLNPFYRRKYSDAVERDRFGLSMLFWACAIVCTLSINRIRLAENTELVMLAVAMLYCYVQRDLRAFKMTLWILICYNNVALRMFFDERILRSNYKFITYKDMWNPFAWMSMFDAAPKVRNAQEALLLTVTMRDILRGMAAWSTSLQTHAVCQQEDAINGATRDVSYSYSDDSRSECIARAYPCMRIFKEMFPGEFVESIETSLCHRQRGYCRIDSAFEKDFLLPCVMITLLHSLYFFAITGTEKIELMCCDLLSLLGFNDAALFVRWTFISITTINIAVGVYKGENKMFKARLFTFFLTLVMMEMFTGVLYPVGFSHVTEAMKKHGVDLRAIPVFLYWTLDISKSNFRLAFVLCMDLLGALVLLQGRDVWGSLRFSLRPFWLGTEQRPVAGGALPEWRLRYCAGTTIWIVLAAIFNLSAIKFLILAECIHHFMRCLHKWVCPWYDLVKMVEQVPLHYWENRLTADQFVWSNKMPIAARFFGYLVMRCNLRHPGHLEAAYKAAMQLERIIPDLIEYLKECREELRHNQGVPNLDGGDGLFRCGNIVANMDRSQRPGQRPLGDPGWEELWKQVFSRMDRPNIIAGIAIAFAKFLELNHHLHMPEEDLVLHIPEAWKKNGRTPCAGLGPFFLYLFGIGGGGKAFGGLLKHADFGAVAMDPVEIDM